MTNKNKFYKTIPTPVEGIKKFNKVKNFKFKLNFKNLKNINWAKIKTNSPFKVKKIIALKQNLGRLLSFMAILFVFLIYKGIIRISQIKFFPKKLNEKFIPKLTKIYNNLINFLDRSSQETISRVDLIALSFKHMKAKKNRTLITVGGMTIGIAAIVFLVSIGYGLQNLVITRVARLEEMKQADVTPQPGSRVKIDDATLSSFKDLPNVSMVLPLIAVVGRVNYQNSISDMAVYGVTSDYLKQSAIKPIHGNIFASNEIATLIKEQEGSVAGTSDEKEPEIAVSGAKIQDVEFNIDPEMWIRVRKNPGTQSEIIGYTRRVGGAYQAETVWGSSYDSDNGQGQAGINQNGTTLGKWIKASVPLWKLSNCDSVTNPDCEENRYLILRGDDNSQIFETGYFAQINVSLTGMEIKETAVLGISDELLLGEVLTASNEADASLSADLTINELDSDWVEIASESAAANTQETKKVPLSKETAKEAVVNQAMLKILNIKENEAIGKKFTTSFIVLGSLLADNNEKIESEPTEYTIIGVTPDEKTPIFYVPFTDLRSLGITNYSQVKVVVDNNNLLSKVRSQIEALGFASRSVADTVAQINSLFGTVRTILALLGLVALAVAALGMFNTLTISLLERTREVGLMKAMGMKSSEIQELFLTDSMIMGLMGGIFGILLGFVAGKLLGFLLSMFAVFRGVGFIDISHIPLMFTLIVIFLSLIVGIFTGIYPAKRAKNISALNALRYE